MLASFLQCSVPEHILSLTYVLGHLRREMKDERFINT